MRKTPTPLPELITGYKHPPYKNIYQICPNEPFVFGTESLYGDWDAELLILGQDVGPADAFERLRDSGHPHPFAHREFRPGHPRYDPSAGTGGAGTNETVYRLAELVGCSKLYGSALIGLCKPGTSYQGKLPGLSALRPHCVQVLKWVFGQKQTRRLRAVMCLGIVAGQFTRLALRGVPARSPAIEVFETPHPAAYARVGKYEAVRPAWSLMAEKLGWSFEGKTPKQA